MTARPLPRPVPLPAEGDARAPLVDGFGRVHTNLRLSVTDRCNIRCTYCMPEETAFLPKDHLLTFEELTRVVRVAAGLGVDKVRLTGGEPLMRSELSTLIRMIRSETPIRDLALTTNGVLLERHARDLRSAGLGRLNISLDSLDREQVIRITRRDCLGATLAGIEAARQAGFDSIKINAIAMKGVTEDQLVPLAHFCRERGLELRFIEFMPLEADGIWDRGRVLTADEILHRLEAAGLPADPIPPRDPTAPAEDYRWRDGRGRLGIVASVSRPFCGDCNRIRLTAEGKFRNCLFSLDETDLRAPIRSAASDEDLAALIRGSVRAKWAGHLIGEPGFVRPPRTMHTIGG
jgi:cyclic pyranopterin phosphate synthase